MGCSVERKRTLVDPDFSQISVARQCQVLGLAKSSYYYKPAGESAFNLELMRLIDEQYIRTPFYGVPKMKVGGYQVGLLLNFNVSQLREGIRRRVFGLKE